MEVLQEFLNSGTFDVDTTWSKEAADLRTLAVLEPWKLTGNAGVEFIHSFFKSLRIIDKQVGHKSSLMLKSFYVFMPFQIFDQVTEIDSSMLRLTNLENLTVSVNLLKEIPSEHLPPTLKVANALQVLSTEVFKITCNNYFSMHLENRLWNTDS